MKKLILLLAFLSFNAFCAATSSDDREVEIFIDQLVDYECLEEPCVDVFPPMSFVQTNNYRQEIQFSAYRVNIQNNIIEFIRPRIKNRIISPSTMRCVEWKTNFFGMEICSRHINVDISNILCEQLGLRQVSQRVISSYRSFRSSSFPFVYKYADSKEEWTSLRVGSVLAPAFNYQGISVLKCRL